jgi:two-component system LytT family response regulator
MTKRTARVVIIDDEAPARSKVARFLAEDPRFLLVSEAEDGASGVLRIVSDRPDLVFLDIQMPAFDGFEVLASVPALELPHVVFTTAFAEHALRAFEVRAVDYLLKPFDQERFRAACDAFWDRRRGSSDAWSVVEQIRPRDRPLERLLVRHRGALIPVRLCDVSRVSAEEKYVRLHTAHGSFLHRMPIKALAARLDTSRFIRLQRGEIVNLDHVASVTARGHGDAVVCLRDGTLVSASRRFRDRWRPRLET